MSPAVYPVVLSSCVIVLAKYVIIVSRSRGPAGDQAALDAPDLQQQEPEDLRRVSAGLPLLLHPEVRGGGGHIIIKS